VYVRIGIVALCVVLLGVALVYDLASSVVADKRSFEEQGRQWALERTSITHVDEVVEYRGKQAYTVVLGKNQMGTPVIAWMTADQVIFDTMDRAVTKESVMTALQKGYPGTQIQHIVPGIDGDRRFWEAAVLDQEGKYHYIHYDFYTGQIIKSYVVRPA